MPCEQTVITSSRGDAVYAVTTREMKAGDLFLTYTSEWLGDPSLLRMLTLLCSTSTALTLPQRMPRCATLMAGDVLHIYIA
jgi:hypothetical protein